MYAGLVMTGGAGRNARLVGVWRRAIRRRGARTRMARQQTANRGQQWGPRGKGQGGKGARGYGVRGKANKAYKAAYGVCKTFIRRTQLGDE